ncbi:Glyoxalase-like domain protein [Anatilimnocola aggregata]|uniref:Glyoxalase-like domain protein n=1 Tax=Anatilimnocola aggregata TaxID=2528021 RepID=A0A517YGH8_9BACT|nr:VOC family protein [Anatilimnocola aggregata]QDU29335.1 Glyoxalase-like domain protein [Anatilimnocola aggregata]
MPKAATQRIAAGMHTVTPHLVVDGAAEAIEFYKQAFGAVEEMRLPGPGGRLMHGCVRIGDSKVFLVDENPEWKCLGPKLLKGTPVTIHLSVEDADKTYAQAVAAGATPVMPVGDAFWGDRYGIVADPFGHNWSIAHHQFDVTPEELMEAMKGACGPQP